MYMESILWTGRSNILTINLEKIFVMFQKTYNMVKVEAFKVVQIEQKAKKGMEMARDRK